jgi:hypothetical protein
MYTGGLARRLRLPNLELWAVPIVLTHPDHGVVGDVGLVAVNAASGEVIGATPRGEVVSAGKKLREAKRYDLEAAISPARAV